MVALSRTPDLLERVIAGEEVSDRRVDDLVPTVRALAIVDIGCHPDPAFVAALGVRLLAEATNLPVRPAGVPDPAAPTLRGSSTASTAGGRTGRGPHPVIIFVGHGWPRLLAGVAASLIAVASIVGVASRSALPGQALYPVKQVLDSAAVNLAGSDLEKGQTLLGQAEGHVVDAARLVDGPPAPADDVTTALTAAIDTTTRGQALLAQADAVDHQAQALLVLRDFSIRLIPQVDALDGRVPQGSVASLQQLRALLGVSADAPSALAGLPGRASAPQGAGSSPGVAVSAPAGASAGVSDGPNPVVNAASPSATAARPGRPASGSTPGAAALAIPGRPGLPAVPGVLGVPGSSGAEGALGGVGTSTSPGSQGAQGGQAGVGIGVGLPGVGAGSGGGAVASGGGGARVSLPQVSATVGVPGGGVGGGGVGIGLPSATVSLPLPGVTVGLPLPGVTIGIGAGNGTGKAGGTGVGGIPPVTGTCILIVCLP